MRLSLAAIKLTLLLLITCATACGSRVGLPGETLPGANLLSVDGSTLSLRDLKDKVVILNFFAPWCIECNLELRALQQIQDRFHKEDLKIIAIAMDSKADAVKAFQEKNQLRLPFMLDPYGTVKLAFGIDQIPQTFLIDKGGKYLDPTGLSSDLEAHIVGPFEWTDEEVIEDLETILKRKPEK